MPWTNSNFHNSIIDISQHRYWDSNRALSGHTFHSNSARLCNDLYIYIYVKVNIYVCQSAKGKGSKGKVDLEIQMPRVRITK